MHILLPAGFTLPRCGLPRGACLTSHPHDTFGFSWITFQFLSKNPSDLLMKAITCDPAAGNEWPGSMGQGNAWHWGDPGGKEGEWVELSGHQSSSVTFPCKLPCCSWTSQPVQLVGLTLMLPLVPTGNVCGCAKHSCVRAQALGTRGREKPDTLDSPPSHEDICSSGFLLP